MYRNRVAVIAPYIGDDDAAFEAGVQVDPVVTGGGYGNHAKRWQPVYGFGIKADLVDDVGLLAVCVACSPVFTGRRVQGNAGTDGVTVEMNDVQACHV